MHGREHQQQVEQPRVPGLGERAHGARRGPVPRAGIEAVVAVDHAGRDLGHSSSSSARIIQPPGGVWPAGSCAPTAEPAAQVANTRRGPVRKSRSARSAGRRRPTRGGTAPASRCRSRSRNAGPSGRVPRSATRRQTAAPAPVKQPHRQVPHQLALHPSFLRVCGVRPNTIIGRPARHRNRSSHERQPAHSRGDPRHLPGARHRHRPAALSPTRCTRRARRSAT
jgi:hypothetical protein